VEEITKQIRKVKRVRVPQPPVDFNEALRKKFGQLTNILIDIASLITRAEKVGVELDAYAQMRC